MYFVLVMTHRMIIFIMRVSDAELQSHVTTGATHATHIYYACK